MCLDYNVYYNQEDYEIECESDDMQKSKKLIIQLLNMLNIKYQESVYSKTARAMKNRIF